VTFLHQYQRTVKMHTFADGKTLEYIEVTAADIALANTLASAVLARSLDDLPPQTRRFLIALHQWAAARAAASDVTLERFSFTRREAREGMGIGQTQAALHLDRLTTHELIIPLRAVGDGLISHYRLAWTPDEANGGVAAANGLGLSESPTSMTPTCRDFITPVGVKGQPVGGLSGSTPTGETTVNHDAIDTKTATCRDFSISRGGDIGNERIVSYMGVVDGDGQRAASAS